MAGKITSSELSATLSNLINGHTDQIGIFSDSVGTVVESFTDLQSALTTIGTPNGTIVVAKPITVTANTTIPSNICLTVRKNAQITVNTGVTLTINSSIIAGIYQIFGGSGTIAGTPSVERLYGVWFGILPDTGSHTDQTSAIDKFLSFASSTRIEAYFVNGDYYCNYIDLSNKGYVTIIGQGKNSEYPGAIFHCLDNTKITNSVGAFLFLSNGGAATPQSNTIRNIRIENITIYDSAQTTTAFGFYANGITYATVKNVTIYGFNIGMALGEGWNNEFDLVNIYHYAQYGLEIGPNSVINAAALKRFNISTDLSATANIYAGWNRSYEFYNLTTQGSATTHVLTDANTEHFVVYGWHVEGGKHLFNVKNLTSKWTSVEVYGADIFLSGLTSDTASRLFLFTNCTGLGGLANITMRGNIQINASTHADYLGVYLVYNADISLNPMANAPSVDWRSIGAGLTGTLTTLVTRRITPLSYDARNTAFSNGVGASYETNVGKTASSIYNTPNTIFHLSEGRGTSPLFFNVTVISSGGTANIPDFATFHISIAGDGTIFSVKVSGNGTNAPAVTFTWDNTNSNLNISSPNNVGYFDIHVICRKSRV
jgi:hypothetical protein